MRSDFKRLFSLKPIFSLKYVLPIIRLIRNWPTFLLNYIGLTNGGGSYTFRDGTRFRDEEGTLTGTIAVVYLRKYYGETPGKRQILDIGANLGVFTTFAARQSPQATLYCYEPSRRNYAILQENLQNNGLSDRVHIFNQAIASESGTRSFLISVSPLGSLAEEQSSIANNNTERVDCVTLKDAFTQNGIQQLDLLKVNCEGGEYEIFYNIDKETLGKIREIRME